MFEIFVSDMHSSGVSIGLEASSRLEALCSVPGLGQVYYCGNAGSLSGHIDGTAVSPHYFIWETLDHAHSQAPREERGFCMHMYAACVSGS